MVVSETRAGSGTGDRFLANTFSRNHIMLANRSSSSGLRLTIEQTPGDIPTLHLSAINAETDCDIVEGCVLTLMLDNGTVGTFRCEIQPFEPQTDLVVSEPTRFIELLKISKKATIALPIRGNGTKAFNFVTHSLKWRPNVEDVV